MATQTLYGRVMLSVQRALIGEISPEMRAVGVQLTPGEINIVLYAERDVEDQIIADFDASAITQIVADFCWPESGDPIVTLECVRLDPGSRVPYRAGQAFAFARVGTTFEQGD